MDEVKASKELWYHGREKIEAAHPIAVLADGYIAVLEAENARLRALDNAVRWLRGIRESPDFRKDGGGRSYSELLDYIYGVFEAAAAECGEGK